MPATATKHRFFIALLPSEEIQAYANQVQQIFADRYDSRAALKSPPHITLQAPFEWLVGEMEALERSLSEFALQQAPVPITLSDFGAFVPRVVFINVVKTPELLALQAALMAHMEATLGIVDPIGKARPFAPHLTVGFRDLTKPNFRAAWAEFQHQPVQFEFTAAQLTLLIHNGQRWNVCSQFPFCCFS
jgi:2'-5' RNA ligase